jgi:hypothetical protein
MKLWDTLFTLVFSSKILLIKKLYMAPLSSVQFMLSMDIVMKVVYRTVSCLLVL